MKITSFNTKITFQKYEKQTLRGGDVKTKWVDLFSVWANVSLMNAKENIELGKTINDFNKKIICRHVNKNIDASMRIKNGSEIYNIINIENIENKNKYFSIIVENFKA